MTTYDPPSMPGLGGKLADEVLERRRTLPREWPQVRQRLRALLHAA